MNAREFVEQNMYSVVRLAMKELIEYIQTSGELEKYWSAVDQQNNDARKAARKVEKERKRIEMGSDYNSSDEEIKNTGFGKEELEDSWDNSNSNSSEYEDYGSVADRSEL